MASPSRFLRLFIASLASLVLLSSCGGGDRCVPGSVVACSCEGDKGLQVCKWDGTFESCSCNAPVPSQTGCQPPDGDMLLGVPDERAKQLLIGDWMYCSGEHLFDFLDQRVGVRITVDGHWASLSEGPDGLVADDTTWFGNWTLGSAPTNLDPNEFFQWIVLDMGRVQYSANLYLFASQPRKLLLAGGLDDPRLGFRSVEDAFVAR